MRIAVALAVALAAPLVADGAETVLLDRVAALVDDSPILLSDVERVVALGLVERREGEDAGELRRRVLEGLVDQRLRLREVERYGAPPVAATKVAAQVAAVEGRFADREAFLAEIARLGLDEDGLRRLVGRQLRVLAYVEERLAARVFVDLEDVKAYYDGELKPALERRGEPAPPLAEVRSEIREVLYQRRLNGEIASWTAELRAKARISFPLDQPPSPLPPVVRRIGPPDGSTRTTGSGGAVAPTGRPA